MQLSRPAVALFTFAGFTGMSAVALGAFAAHGLAKIAPTGERAVALFTQATDFQMSQTLALILVTLVAERVTGASQTVMRIAAGLMALSILLFPTALYSAAFGGQQFWAPYGGNAAMLGWLAFGAGALLTWRKGETAPRALGQPHAAE
jgi:uncharacterized membrane protein YgdD (TMEM256/DUF423 family)